MPNTDKPDPKPLDRAVIRDLLTNRTRRRDLTDVLQPNNPPDKTTDDPHRDD